MFYITCSDQVKIAVYNFDCGGKHTVLLIHGWPLSHKMYEYQIERLISHGYRVVTFDIRGFGNSDAPACGYSYDRMAMDLYEIMMSLRLNDITLAGFSMGGAIALRYMNMYQGYGVRQLMLLAAAAPSWTRRPGYPFGLTRDYVDGLIEQACTDRPKLVHDFTHEQLFACKQTEEAKNWFQDIALSASGIGTVEAAISLRDEDGRKDLKAVRVPTVIIHGAKDVVVSNELAAIQHKEINGSRLYTLKDSGHGIVYDELEKFNRIFIGQIDGICRG